MNKSKTKVMMETDTPVYVNNTQIENVESYIYLGQRYSTIDKNQAEENQRRITAGWTAFTKHSDIFKGNIGTSLKRQVYNSCVLLAMTYDTEIWTLTTLAKNKLAASNKDGKEYVKHHIPGQTNKHLGKRKDKGHRRD